MRGLKGGLFLLSLLYTAVSVFRNFLFNIGILKTRKLSAPVISVGNITAGGTGKTPTTLLIGEILKNSGKPFAILSRGYGRSTTLPFALRTTETMTAAQIGDEPKMLGERLQCPVGISGNRFKMGRLMTLKFGPRTLIMDDGFSHRFLHRDLNIVLLDQENPWGRHMLPLGTRRETLKNLLRADVLLVTRDSERVNLAELSKKIATIGFQKPILTARRVPESIVTADGISLPLSDFKDTPFYLFSGIANGNRFASFVKSHGLTETGHISYFDHYRFDQEEIDQIRKNAGTATLLTTEKDFYRLGPLAQDIHYLRIRMAPDKPEEFEQLILTSSQR